MKIGLFSWICQQWDRCAAWIAVLAGALMLLVGWAGVSGTPYTAKQIPYLASDGLGGMFLLGLGAMLWLSADLRDEWRMLDLIRRTGTAGGLAETPAEDPSDSRAGASPGLLAMSRGPR